MSDLQHWDHNRAMARAEARWLSQNEAGIPQGGNIEPRIWQEFKAQEGLPCESDEPCTNNATKSFTVMGGKEGHEYYESIDLCDEHSDEPMYHYHERRFKE